MPGVEAVPGPLDRTDRDGSGGESIQAPNGVLGDLAFELEARDLAEGMDAGIGPSGDRQGDRLTEQGLECGLELPLNRRLALLGCPSAER